MTIALADYLRQQHIEETLSSVIESLAYSSQKILLKLQLTGLHTLTGKTGTENVHGDAVEKIDLYADHVLTTQLLKNSFVHAVMTEELTQPRFSQRSTGQFTVFLDPLDGSSNVDINGSSGTIFSIYAKKDSLLQPGSNQLVAGYILYGPATIFVLTFPKKVVGFTLHQPKNIYLLSYPNLQIPTHGKIYAVNEGNMKKFSLGDQKYLAWIKEQKTYKLRNCGAMVGEIHRILLKGGIFLYPSEQEHINGKLRLLYEVNPMSLLINTAGGNAVTNGDTPLNILPESLHQHAPIAIGSRKNISEYLTQSKDER